MSGNQDQGKQMGYIVERDKEVQASTKITRIFDLLGGANSNAARIAELSRSINVALLGPEPGDQGQPKDDECVEVGLLERVQICLHEIQAILSISVKRLEEVDKQLKL